MNENVKKSLVEHMSRLRANNVTIATGDSTASECGETW